MCGISVVINGTYGDVHSMGQAINRRGNIRTTSAHGDILVSFNQLKITDQSSLNKQPFVSGKYTVWLNGYISNYLELAIKYNITLDTTCDGELLAKLFNKAGTLCVDELSGFFAIVVYVDGLYGQVLCYTDRYGIKQLYEYRKGKTTFICSEVKGILAACPEIKLNALAVQEWKYSLGVMTKDTIYDGIERVNCIPFCTPNKIDIDYNSALKQLTKLFNQSIERNRAPLGIKSGVFLSGGIDSGIIAKYIKPDYSFSMDYLDEKFSEIENIKLNSAGKHYSIICNEQLFEEYKFKTLNALDDLKAGSCYTNFALTELASKFCTIIYSGAGGDEFFGGYNHRLNKPINDVIKRTNLLGPVEFTYDGSKFNYDLLFLRAVLVVEDRMAGYHTMETRYPLLDNDLVDFALSLPDEYLKNKLILKDISGLNEAVLTSSKKGFSNPYCTNEDWVNLCLNNLNKK